MNAASAIAWLPGLVLAAAMAVALVATGGCLGLFDKVLRALGNDRRRAGRRRAGL